MVAAAHQRGSKRRPTAGDGAQGAERDVEREILACIECCERQFADAEEPDAPELPFFLRRYSARVVLARWLRDGADVLERLQRHEDACRLLRLLLARDAHRLMPYSLGSLYERLSINLAEHLGRPAEALAACHAGMQAISVARRRGCPATAC